MALKYNSRAELESKLAILKCCIGTKGIELSNSIALALGNVDCLTKELEMLNKYYDILSCYYPYDCWSDDDFVTETCCNVKVIPEVVEYTLVTPQFLETKVFDIAVGIANNIEGYITDSFIRNVKIYNSLLDNFVTLPLGAMITTSTTIVELFDIIVDYINTNRFDLGYTISYTIDLGSYGYRFTMTAIACDLDYPVTPFWGFELFVTFTSISPASRVFAILETSTCPVYDTTVIRDEIIECQENCLTDEQIEKITRHAMSLCECCLDIYINNNLE